MLGQNAEKLTIWLAANVAHAERNPVRVREELLKHCREEFIEPPTPDRLTRMVRSALYSAEETRFARIAARLTAQVRVRVLALVAADDAEKVQDGAEAEDGESVLVLINAMCRV